MTKKDLFNRLENAYSKGLITPEIIRHTYNVVDAVNRLEGGQFDNFMDFMSAERNRLERFRSDKILANDKLAYSCIELLSLLAHPCQICAEDPKAWHTRPGFCPHKK